MCKNFNHNTKCIQKMSINVQICLKPPLRLFPPGLLQQEAEKYVGFIHTIDSALEQRQTERERKMEALSRERRRERNEK